MAASTYKTALAQLRRDEGGYVNHPSDPGGATNHGVTQAVYNSYRKSLGLKTRSVKEIAEAEVASIYRTRYADKVRYDDLPAGVDYATFDAAVNSGVSRGAKWLQATVGAAADGIVGAATVARARAADPVKTVKGICSRRLGFVQGLKTWKVFGRGWSRRIAGVEATSVKMTLTAGGMSATGIAAVAAEEAKVAAKNAKSQTATAATSAASGTGATAGVDVTGMDQTGTILLVVAAVCLVAFAVYLFHHSRNNKARAEAYGALAAEGAQA